MIVKIRKYQFLLITLFASALLAQDEAYKGGPADGADMAVILSDQLSFKGGNGDGYAMSQSLKDVLAFKGGPADGADFSFVERQNLSTKGGRGDGHVLSQLLKDVLAFKGGPADGFSSSIFCPIIQWTGMSGSGWGVATNWDINQVPCNCNKVVIPSGVAIFPAINEGLFKIGYPINNGDFNCEALRIETGAQLITRVNNFIENHGTIIIKGIMEVRNPDPNAFMNYSEIQIRSGGLLNFDNY